MVWGAFSMNGLFPLVVIKGSMTAEQYQHVFGTVVDLPKCGPMLCGEHSLLQQDNAPIHRAKSTLELFKEHISDCWDGRHCLRISTLWRIYGR